MTRRIAWTVVPLALTLAACGPRYGRVVPPAVVEKLPYESRIELLEAENELAVAADRADESHAQVLRARDAIRRASSRLSSAEGEEREARDAPSREVARLAIDEARARVDFLRGQQAMNGRAEELEALSLRCAYARFQQSTLQSVRKAKVVGSETLQPEEFDRQVKECEAEVAKHRAALRDDAKKPRAGEDGVGSQEGRAGEEDVRRPRQPLRGVTP